MYVCVAQDPSFLKRMSEWQFAKGSRVMITHLYSYNTTIPSFFHALREHLQAPECTLTVGWQWDAFSAQLLANILPTIPHMGVIVENKDLTDAFLSLALHMGPSLHGVRVDRLAVKSLQHASAPMHWGTLEVRWLDLAEIVGLPCNYKQCTVRVEMLILSTDAIIKVRALTHT